MIIEISRRKYFVKKRVGPFKFFVRKGFKRLRFYDFSDVVKYVVEKNRITS